MVRSTRSFSLVVSSHVMGALEGLTLLGSLNISGTGNGLNNLIIGNSGNNALAGNAGADSMRGNGGNDVLRGGAGSDTMTGGAGSDAFLFDSPIGGIDRITDFNTADTIRLENAVFTAIAGIGVLTAGQFVRNGSGLAQDANDRIVYETDTGRLSYDSNGNAAGGSNIIAILAPNLALTNADFVVV
jgi:serralysin